MGRGASSLCVKRTRKAHEPMKVDHSEAASQAGEEPLAKPSAPQRVKPMAPMRFHSPMCHPSVAGEGVYQFGCVSSMKSHEEIMKPVPPTTLGGWCVVSVGVFLSGGHGGLIAVGSDGTADHFDLVTSSMSSQWWW